jgi:transposase
LRRFCRARRGYDAAKKTVGRKRHIEVDSDGRPLMVNLTSADISDSAYDRTQLMDKAAFLDFVVEVVRRVDHESGIKVRPRRWVVERTFGALAPGRSWCATTSSASRFPRP